MSLSRATMHGKPLGLPAGPVRCARLGPLVDLAFELPADDPWVLEAHTAAHGYLDAARQAWVDQPEWVDVLAPDSPAHLLKAVETALYAHHWAPWLDAERVLDVGCGVGRLTLPLLDRGATVWGVDADLQSLRRLAWRAAGRRGALDLSWSSVHVLPPVQVDLVLAVEVWCYVPDVEAALAQAVARLRPGGALLLSMEARWGWALAADAPEGAVAHALVGDGVLDLPGDRWVRCWEEAELVAWLEAAGLRVEAVVPTHYVLDGPLEAVVAGVPELDVLLDLEEAARAHPVWSPLNRIWTVAAVRP